MSGGLVDIINLIGGRPDLIGDIAQAPTDMRNYLAGQCKVLLETSAFHDGLQGLIVPDALHAAHVEKVTLRLAQIADAGEGKK